MDHPSERQLIAELSKKPLSELWSERVSGTQQLCALLVERLSSADVTSPRSVERLDAVATALATQLADRRSAVIDALCAEMCTLSVALPVECFEALLLSGEARLLRALLRLLVVTVGAISRPADRCAALLLCEGKVGSRLRNGQSALWPALRTHLQHPHPVLRRQLYTYLLRLCEASAAESEHGCLPAHTLTCVGKQLRAGLIDAEPVVRQASARCVHLLGEADRARFDATLSVEVRRKLEQGIGEESHSKTKRGGSKTAGKADRERQKRREAMLEQRKRLMYLKKEQQQQKAGEAAVVSVDKENTANHSAGGGVLMIF